MCLIRQLGVTLRSHETLNGRFADSICHACGRAQVYISALHARPRR